jgi:hypothetical protein
VQTWQRSIVRRVLGGALALIGLGACLALLTVGAVASAWPTAHRWTVLLLFAGAYLAAGLLGIWLVRRRDPGASPAGLLLGEIRKDAELVSAVLRERSQ